MDTNTTADAGANASSNSDASLEYLVASIKRSLASAQGAGMDTLYAFKDIGTGLLEAKEITSGTKGAFGAWCDANFNFSKEWRARLMKLAAAWADFIAAKEWAEAQGRLLGRKEFSVDGALAFINEWEKATNPEPEAEGGEGEGEGGEGGEKAKKETAAEKLRRELAEALERIRVLEDELRAARGEGPKAKAKEKASAGTGSNPIDPATRSRAKKVYALYQRGGTDGEKAAAKSRLEEMAAKFSMDFDAFVKACGC